MPIYEIESDRIRKIEETTFGAAGLRERYDLQRLLRVQIDILVPGDPLLVIAEEFGQWEDSRRRIDLLALDGEANLVVVELKRTEDGGLMDLQAVRYAAMVSTMTFEQAVETYQEYLRHIGGDADAQSAILEFLDWDEPQEDSFAQDVRIVLASAEFSKELTSAVIWLNDRGLDIRCVRIRPYADDGRTLIDVQQVIPLPEAADFQVRVSAKSRQERNSRATSRDFTKFDVSINAETLTRLAKRNAIFAIVKRLCDGGVSPDQIAALIPWRSRRLFFVVDGRLDPEAFVAAASEQREADGKHFARRRWFCDEGELILAGSKTYAFSNQWGHRWHEAMDNLVEAFPAVRISYGASPSD